MGDVMAAAPRAERTAPPAAGGPGVLFVLPQRYSYLRGGAHSNLLLMRHFGAWAPQVLTNVAPLCQGARDAAVPCTLVEMDPIRPSVSLVKRVPQAVAHLPLVRAGIRLARGCAVVQTDWEMAWVGQAVARASGRPLVIYLRDTPKRQIGVRSLLRLFGASLAVTISDALRDEVLAATGPFRGALEKRVVTIRNGVDLAEVARRRASLPREAARAALGIPPGEIALVVVGTVEAKKGQASFIRDVLSTVPREQPWTLYLVGDDRSNPEYRAACLAEAERAHARGRLRFLGYDPEVWRWYCAMDVICVPSRYEGISRAAIEAQAYGVPVVASRILGMNEAVLDGESGFIADTPERMAHHLSWLFANPQARAAMGAAGHAHVARHFDARHSAARMEAQYARLVGRSGAAAVHGETRVG
jgi:glycosyltransferase involved in cell wall biosynthesis